MIHVDDRHRLTVLVLAVLMLVVVAQHSIWNNLNDAPLCSGDAYNYLSRTLSFAANVSSDSELKWDSLRQLSLGGRPPLFQVLSLPFIWLFGRSEDAALTVNLMLWLLLLWATFRLGSLVGDGTTGLLAAAFAAAYPPLILLSRAYLPYFGLATMVALSMSLLVQVVITRRVSAAWWFGASLGLGMLMHPVFVWYLPFPTALFTTWVVLAPDRDLPAGLRALPYWLINRVRTPLFLRGLLPGLALGAAMTLPWYLTRGRVLLQLQLKLSSPELAAFRGTAVTTSGFPDIKASIWWYVQTAPGAISFALTGLAFAGVVCCFARARLPAVVVGVTAVCSWLLLSLKSSLAWAYFAPLLPVLAVASALAITIVNVPIVRRTLAVLSLAVAALIMITVWWGSYAWSRPIVGALGARLDTEGADLGPAAHCGTMLNFCPSPPRSGTQDAEQVLRAIFDDPDFKADGTSSLFAVMHATISRDYLSYLVTRDSRQHTITLTTPASALWGNTYPLSELLESDYLVTFQNDWAKIPVKVDQNLSYNMATVRLLCKQPPLFNRSHTTIAKIPATPKGEFLVLKRTEPLTIDEVKETAELLAIKDSQKAERYFVLASLQALAAGPSHAMALIELGEKKAQIGSARTMYRRRIGRLRRPSKPMEEKLLPLWLDVVRHPDGPGHRVKLALELSRHGQKGDAIEELHTAVALAPEMEWPWQVLAGVYSSLGDDERAARTQRNLAELRARTHPAGG